MTSGNALGGRNHRFPPLVDDFNSSMSVEASVQTIRQGGMGCAISHAGIDRRGEALHSGCAVALRDSPSIRASFHGRTNVSRHECDPSEPTPGRSNGPYLEFQRSRPSNTISTSRPTTVRTIWRFTNNEGLYAFASSGIWRPCFRAAMSNPRSAELGVRSRPASCLTSTASKG